VVVAAALFGYLLLTEEELEEGSNPLPPGLLKVGRLAQSSDANELLHAPGEKPERRGARE
jgi:hypothetical protein